ncbi:UxaA family hydrolase [Govanella unica]|uniref:Altronate dehydratase family protein n=1 Tax=Govanella unica TaxID=2975056 RepID=A0A9X3Z778_9PROT|nr:altronate dehydratase family protein [Govania unica]MDA5193862.1 altronate dehydratase family protein [Govania unica]
MDKIVRLHMDDNVAIATEPLGMDVVLDSARNLKTVQFIPVMHKVALRDIAVGDAIVKYRQVIGRAAAYIPAGAHVHTHNCIMNTLTTDYDFCTATTATQYVPLADRRTFQGYRRQNGKVGTRNYIGILTSVNCSATVARHIADAANRANLFAPYPNVDGVVALVHGTGCGMRGSGDGYENLKRVLHGYANHPNFAGILLVGLGCEVMQIKDLFGDGLDRSERVTAFTIQDAGGTRKAVTAGLDALKAMLPQVNACQRETVLASELTLALQCGGSDAYSGITANPALGAAADLLIEQGGTAILSETPELYGAEHLLIRRATDRSVAEALIERIRWWERYTKANGDELNNNPSPGNKAGGLTTILEKSLGAMAKGGSTNLTGVFRYAEAITRKGLVVMDSPGFDPASVTGQVASGANIICFTTGRGSAFGFKPVPSIKLTTNSALYENMSEDMDINCGDIITGDSDVRSKGAEIFESILAVASGQLTKSEELDYGDNEFTPWQIGSVM